MRILVITATTAAIIAWLLVSCSRSSRTSPQSDLMNCLTSKPGTVNLSTGRKLRLAMYMVGKLQSLTNSTRRSR